MRKKVLFIVMFLAFSAISWGQITQAEADSIILEKMNTETRPHIVYAKTDSATITTTAGELLTLDYPCWIYYIRYADQTDTVPANRRYLVVKESSGNLLEVRTKNDVAPDLTTWRKVPADPEPLDSLVLIAKGNLTGGEGIFKQNTVITTQTAWEDLITAMDSIKIVSDSFAEINIDFSKYRIVAIFDTIRPNGGWSVDITDITEYADSIVITYTNLDTGDLSCSATQSYYIIKIPASNKPIVFIDNTIPTKNVSITDYSLVGTNCSWNFSSLTEDSIYVINSQQELFTLLDRYQNSIPPTIDFNQYSLLFVWGRTYSTYNFLYDVTKNLWQISDSVYKLDVEVMLDEGAIPNSLSQKMYWRVAILIPKLAQNASIMLCVNIDSLSGNNLPEGTIFTTKYMPNVNWDTQVNINDTTIYIINSQQALYNLTGRYDTLFDFNQYSVLFVHGHVHTGFGYIIKNLQQLSENNYKLNIKVVFMLGSHPALGTWTIALVVKKINLTDNIILNVEHAELFEELYQ